MLLREAERRRNTDLDKIKAVIIANSPIKPEAKMEMTVSLLEEAIEKSSPWRKDKRSAEEIEKTMDQQLEDFYYKNIEAYEKNKALIEEIERGR